MPVFRVKAIDDHGITMTTSAEGATPDAAQVVAMKHWKDHGIAIHKVLTTKVAKGEFENGISDGTDLSRLFGGNVRRVVHGD